MKELQCSRARYHRPRSLLQGTKGCSIIEESSELPMNIESPGEVILHRQLPHPTRCLKLQQGQDAALRKYRIIRCMIGKDVEEMHLLPRCN